MFTLTQILMGVGVIAVAFMLVKLYARLDSRVEERRRKAIKVAHAFSEYGLVRLPRIITNYAVGDYSGIAAEVSRFMDQMEDGVDPVMQEVEKVFSTVLTKKLSTEVGRALVKAQLDAATGVVSTPTATPAVV
jgi:hypothetical protein